MSRREQIIDHAGELISSVGYHGFSYADLAARLGVTKASIHHHFASKEDLGIAYCETKAARLAALREQLESLPYACQRLERYFDLFRECSGEKICGINALQSDFGDMPEALSRWVQRVGGLELELLSEILAAGKAQGVFSFDGPAFEQALVVSSALKGALQYARINGDDSLARIIAAVKRNIGCR